MNGALPEMDARKPVLEGWFTLDSERPHLLGTRCQCCGTYYFPKLRGYCRNPDCSGAEFDEVKLSRTGRLWSFTTAAYQPPEPYVVNEPFRPFGIAAVELEHERMIVLGQIAGEVPVSDLHIGLQMELVLEHLDDGKLTWKWKPCP